MSKKEILNTLKIVIVALLVGAGISTIQAAETYTWKGPCGALGGDGKPTCNAAAPLNVGSSPQVKDGGLSLGSLIVRGDTVLGNPGYDIQIKSGSPAAGKVLTAVDSQGTATWQDKTGGSVTLSDQFTVTDLPGTTGETSVVLGKVADWSACFLVSSDHFDVSGDRASGGCYITKGNNMSNTWVLWAAGRGLKSACTAQCIKI
jgi:hypothetical protein